MQQDLKKPSVVMDNDCIYIVFSRYTIAISKLQDRIEIDGIWLRTTRVTKHYAEPYKKAENVARKKERIKTLYSPDGRYVLAIDRGYDGRIFFKAFYVPAFHILRGKLFWIASYWHNRYEGRGEFYEEDLHTPVHTWHMPSRAERQAMLA